LRKEKNFLQFPAGNDKLFFTFRRRFVTVYIHREIERSLIDSFRQSRPNGVILVGVVGCGKTTLVEYCLDQLKSEFTILRFSGDDIQFRAAVAGDSRYIHSQVRALTQGRALVFVDEVQKSEAIFDAIKYAFDHSKVSFIVSGSNPGYLSTVARKRLQRRATLVRMCGFSMPEILAEKGLVDLAESRSDFQRLLLEASKAHVPSRGLSLTEEISRAGERYLVYGGIPLAHLTEGQRSLEVVRSVIDRGFEAIRTDNLDFNDLVEVELARIHSREFTYTSIFQRTGERRRDKVNHVVSGLIDHGYLVEKRPVFPDEARRSYLCVYSYTDPGFVAYLTGETRLETEMGSRIEGVVHTRLSLLLSAIPLRSELGYYKPYQVDPSGATRFLPGEVDFVVSVGKRVVPIEVKATRDPAQIKLEQLTAFVERYGSPFGIVVYGGVPFADARRRLVFWPWWLI
jgi:predicted AAA+ superfamily ATPase